ncbi:MAG: BatD family protein [Candidatus Krumholzibacteriota bacterium]|nr:BatD family protein [Candidatus Krumholzibacteriota bacterium]
MINKIRENKTGQTGAAAVSFVIFLVIIFLVHTPAFSSNGIIARMRVESKNVYVGGTFIMQITIMGSTDVERPDLSNLKGFEVEFAGGSNNSSQSVSIVNGNFSRTVKKEYVFSYRLTPLESGVLRIPSIAVEVEGKDLKTNALTINVREPEETEDFKLRLRLSRESCFVGEPVILSVVWYLREDVNSFNVTAPLLQSSAFDIEKPEMKLDKRKKYFRVPIGDREFIALKGKGTLEGERYATLEFEMALIPKKPGVFSIPEFIISCEVGGGFGRDNFFDDFFSRHSINRERQRKYVVPSNSPSLTVKELPKEGRPDDFSGYVGEYKISAAANPTVVDVGDPITLKITLEGSDFMNNINLPPLGEIDGFSDNFKIPSERAAGVIEDGKKIFTQTIRAKSHKVTRVPPVRIVSFDTAEERYITVESKPIPLTVNPTRTVTASDAEGLNRAREGSALEHWRDGIAYNYKGEDLLVRADYGFRSLMSHRWSMLLLGVPPVLFVILLTGNLMSRRRKSDPMARRARGAARILKKKLSSLAKDDNLSREVACGRMLEALKEYLGNKLRREGSALTSGEVEKELERRGINAELIESLTEIIRVCEHGTYAGVNTAEENDILMLTDRVDKIISRLDKKL